MADRETTTELLRIILNDLSTDANALRQSLYADEFNQAHVHAIVAEKMGWLADLGLKVIAGKAEVQDSAALWFMPPAYRAALEKSQEVNHDC